MLAIAALVATPAASQRAPETFDSHAEGRLPEGFTLAAMRQAGPGTWRVGREGANRFLVHETDPAAEGFAMAVVTDPALLDVVVSARLRLPGGARRGGLVWRYLDEGNYYAAELDLARGFIALIRVTRGNRIFLEGEDGLELDVNAWHTLKITHQGPNIAVSLGGIRVFRERDRRFSGDAPPGRAGVIATGASEVWFDDLLIEPERAIEPARAR